MEATDNSFDNFTEAMQAAGGRKPKTYATAPYSLLEQEASRRAVSVSALAAEHGYSVTAGTGWKAKNTIPKVLGDAIKLRRELDRLKGDATADDRKRTVLFAGVLKPGMGEEQAKLVLSAIFERCKLMDIHKP